MTIPSTAARMPRSRMGMALALVIAVYIVLDLVGVHLIFPAIFQLTARASGSWGATAAQVQQVSQASAARERELSPVLRSAAFLLGQRVAMAAHLHMLGTDPAENARHLAQARAFVAEGGLDRLLGVAPIEPVLPRTADEVGNLRLRFESDADGLAASIEAATTPRHRHLFIAGLHVGDYSVALINIPDVDPVPDGELIARHAALAGLPRRLWEPIARPAQGTDAAQKKAAYSAALVAVVQALEAPGYPPAGE